MLPVLLLLLFALAIIIGLHLRTVRNNRKLLRTVTDLHRGT